MLLFANFFTGNLSVGFGFLVEVSSNVDGGVSLRGGSGGGGNRAVLLELLLPALCVLLVVELFELL